MNIKSIIKLSFGIGMLILIQLVFPLTSSAESSTRNITFNDINMYEAINSALGNKVSSKNEQTKTIEITQANIETITELKLTHANIVDISGIENFTYLTSLNFSYNQISDIRAVSNLTNLNKLYIQDNQISNISAVSGLRNLKQLYAYGNQISDISTLSNLTNLNVLDIGGNQISNINAVSNLTNLTLLDLGENQISNINAVSNLSNLTWIVFRNNQISDISAVSNLTNLALLDSGGNQISDISAVSGLIKLNDLSLRGNQISNINAVSNLTNLRVLNISKNQISDISTLSNLTNLGSLNISENQISDISAVSNLTNLTFLDLGGNQISNINAVSNLSNLNKLYIHYNQISDISAVSNLTNLTFLDLGGNQISNINAVSNLSNLNKLYINDNQINDINPIKELELDELQVSNQKLEMTVQEAQSSKLPKIFQQAFDGYGATSIETYNCSVNNEHTEVISEKGVKEATATIKEGKLDGSILTIKVEDKSGPILKVTYSQPDENTGSVAVRITSDEQIQEVEGWMLSEDGLSIIKIYNENKTEKVTVKDLSGNETEVTVEVTTVKKDTPTEKPGDSTEILNLQLEYSTTNLTNKDVVVTIKSNLILKELEGWNLSSNKKEQTKTYSENTNQTIKVQSEDGQEKEINVIITNIDKEAPKVEVVYSTQEETTGRVIVKIKSNEKLSEVEGWILSADRLTLQKIYDENKEEEVEVKDLAGNVSKINIKIDNIVKQDIDKLTDKDKDKDEDKDEENKTIQTQGKKEDTTTSTAKKLPNTGLFKNIFILAIVTISVVFYKKWNKYKKY